VKKQFYFLETCCLYYPLYLEESQETDFLEKSTLIFNFIKTVIFQPVNWGLAKRAYIKIG